MDFTQGSMRALAPCESVLHVFWKVHPGGGLKERLSNFTIPREKKSLGIRDIMLNQSSPNTTILPHHYATISPTEQGCLNWRHLSWWHKDKVKWEAILNIINQYYKIAVMEKNGNKKEHVVTVKRMLTIVEGGTDTLEQAPWWMSQVSSHTAPGRKPLQFHVIAQGPGKHLLKRFSESTKPIHVN